MQYLQGPGSFPIIGDFRFSRMLPGSEELNDWQQLQRAWMEWQFSNWQPYAHTSGHSGCIEDEYFRGNLVLRGGLPGVYCCGLALEHWLKCWKDWLGLELFESEYDLTLEQFKTLYAHFFAFADSEDAYTRGSAGGVAWLGSFPDSITDCWNLAFRQHSDPYQAQFGAYMIIQFEEDWRKQHSCIFVGLEQRQGQDCARVFQANSTRDYGMRPGVNLGWYRLDHEKNGFKRQFHFGEISPVGDMPGWGGASCYL